MSNPDCTEIHHACIEEQLHSFIDQHREMLFHALDDVTEAQARTRLVPSSTTLLGLVKHATFVERVWFEQTVTGRSRQELGLQASPEESFQLEERDTIDSVRSQFEATVERSRRAVAGMGLDDELAGNRRGPLPLRWILLHVLREHAQHCGHVDILREQLLRSL